jgi:hypothetical protein
MVEQVIEKRVGNSVLHLRRTGCITLHFRVKLYPLYQYFVKMMHHLNDKKLFSLTLFCISSIFGRRSTSWT